MPKPELALIVTTYQRPVSLKRVLTSIACQETCRLRMELVVADDGSTDATPQTVREFSRSVDFPVRFTTHPHTVFHLARCRNEGAAASTAPYLIFLDGDCVIPPDHLAQHLEHRKRGVVMAGYCYHMSQQASEQITDEDIRTGEYLRWVSRSERRKVDKMDRKARFYNWIRHPTKPKLFGGNIGIWREDFEHVNGFDENFQGWGCEDDDLRLRLRRAGLRIESILRWTRTCHLWHPKDPTAPEKWREGANVAYFQRKIRFTRCRNGLNKRAPKDLVIRIVGHPSRPELAEGLLPARSYRIDACGQGDAEIEILFLPGTGRFSGRADCNMLVVLKDSRAAARMARKAHLVVSDHAYPGVDARHRFRLDELKLAVRAAALGGLPSRENEPNVGRAA